MTPERKVTTTARALARAVSRADAARDARDEAIREAVAAGLSLREVARLADVSHQAVAKIAHADTAARR